MHTSEIEFKSSLDNKHFYIKQIVTNILPEKFSSKTTRIINLKFYFITEAVLLHPSFENTLVDVS